MATRRQLLPIYLGAIIGPLGGVGIITLLPVLAREWQTNIQWISLTVTLYMTPYVIFQLFSGSIAQVFNTRRTLLFGLSIYSLGGLLCGLSPNLEILLGARFIQGFGAAFIAPLVLALVGDMVNPAQMGKAVGFLGMMYTTGVTMGPLISGILEVNFNWSFFFFFLASFAGLVGILYFFSENPSSSRAQGSGKLTDAFVFVSKALSFPQVQFLSWAAFSLFFSYIGLMTFIADHLKNSFALPSDRLGLILSMTGFLGIVASPLAGFLGDRYGRIRIAYLGGGIMIGAILGLEMVTYSFSKYLLLFALFGTGAATAWTSLNTLAVEIVPELRKPVASVYNCLKFSGYALSPLLLSLLYIPFSISVVRLACTFFILFSLLLASRVRVRPKGE